MKIKQLKTSDSVCDFLSMLRHVSENYKIHYDQVNKYDKETQDILQQIELGSCKDRNKFATSLAKVRKSRRLSKDYVEIHRELVEYMSEPEFIRVQRKLEQILGILRKHENIIENSRSYRAKVRDDLTILQNEEK